jgi:hypothetical protein
MKRILVVAIVLLSFIGNAPCGATTPLPVLMSEAVRFAAEFKAAPEENLLPSTNVLRMRIVAIKMTKLGLEQAQHREWDSAENSLLTALHINEAIEGSDSKSVAASLSNLIGLYLAQDKYISAEPLIERFFKRFHNGGASASEHHDL